MGDEIEDDPLGLEQGFGRSRDAGHFCHGGHGAGLRGQRLPVEGRVESAQHFADNGQAHHQGGFLGPDDRVQLRIGRKQGPGGKLRAVLFQGQGNGLL